MDADAKSFKKMMDSTHEVIHQAIADSQARTYSDVQLPLLMVLLNGILSATLETNEEVRKLRGEIAATKGKQHDA